jgi:putative heme-binding domain-containing protein
MAETGRGAPAGLCILNSAAFPPSTRNLLVYPDVFRKSVRAYKVKPEGATFKVAEEFELLAADEGLFRPTDAEIGPDGALYILDWRTDSGGAGQLSGNGKTGRIYRMTWSGTDDEPARGTFPPDRLVKAIKGSDASLIAHLRSEDYGLRRAASMELIRRGVPAPRSIAQVLLEGNSPRYARFHALAILNSRSPNRPEPLLVRRRISFDGDPGLARVALEFDSRFGKADDVAWADALLSTPRVGRPPEYLRAFALALGRFNSLARARPGENVDHGALMQRYGRELGITPNRPAPNLTQADYQEILEAIYRGISSDMIAQALLDMAQDTAQADAFLRDGITRGLERIGPAGTDAMLNGITTEGPKRIAASLFVLQGFRTKGAVAAVLAQATTRGHLPAPARAGLFQTLRELVADVRPEPIVEWLRDNSKADPAAQVEAIRVLTAMQLRAIPATGPIVAPLLKSAHERVRNAALILAANVHSDDARNELLDIVKKANRSVDERRSALTALRSYEDKRLAPELASLFETSTDAGFLGELLGTLASLDFPTAATHAEALLTSKDTAVRHEAVRLLGQKPETALVVAKLYNESKLPAEDLASVIEAVRPHSTPELQAATQQLLKNKLLAAPTGDEAKRLRDFVSRSGNAARGKDIYLDAKKGGCAVCHRLEGSGGSVGPDLTRMWETLSFDKRVESLLEPSKEIKEGFTTFKVATKNGQVLTGLLVENTPEAVTLKDAQGREVKIPAAEIEEKGADPVSLMPVGVVGHLSLEELADLLSFLGDRSAQESLRAK